MTRLTTTLLMLLVLVGIASSSTGAFSLGRLFPASRRGVRGTLLQNNSVQKTTGNLLKEAVKQVATKATPTQAKTQQPVTNSPIYYIRLPPSPYVYMPGMGYVSPNTNFNFLRPDINFINNGKPSSIFHFKAPATTTTSKAPFMTTPATTTTTTTTTTTPAPTTTTTKPVKPVSPTQSPITWLPGAWTFNGRPSNLFIFNSPHNPSPFDKLHQKYNKPGFYLK